MQALLEKINSKESIVAYRYKDENFNFPLHYHPEYELVYIAEGSGTRFVGDRVESFECGELVLLGSNISHCWLNQKGSTAFCESLVLQWKSELVDNKPELGKIQTLLNNSKRGLRFKTNKEVVRLLTEVVHSSGVDKYILLLQILTLLTKDEDVLSITSAVRPNKLSAIANDRLNKVFNYVEENYQSKIRLILMADLVNMSHSSFSRFFSVTMGRPFFEFLNEYRIQKVCRLLQEEDIPVSDACFMSGFESLPYFHRQFLRFKNVTPLHYKKKYQQLNDVL